MRMTLAWLTVTCGVLVGCQAGPNANADQPTFEVRLVYQAPGPDREAREYRGETIYLGRVVISDQDLVEVHPGMRDGELRLAMGMTEDAAERMFEATSAHVGQRVAVLLEGRIRSVVNVAGPLGKGPDTVLGSDPSRGWPIDVALDGSDEDAPGLIERIRARWPAPEPSSAGPPAR